MALGKKLLLVDDDAKFRDAVMLAFEDSGYVFIEAQDVKEAAGALESHPDIEVILLDLELPGEDGLAFLEKVKPHSEKYRVIVLTAHDEMLAAPKAQEFNVFYYLTKTARTSSQTLKFAIDQAFKDLEREFLRKKSEAHLEIEHAINDGKNLPDILNLACQHMLELTGAYTCNVRVFDEDKGDFPLTSWAGPFQDIEKEFEDRLEFQAGYVDMMKSVQTPVVYDDFERSEFFENYNQKIRSDESVNQKTRHFFDRLKSVYLSPIPQKAEARNIKAVFCITSDKKAYFSDTERRGIVDDFIQLITFATASHKQNEKQRKLDLGYQEISGMLTEVSSELKGDYNLNKIYDFLYQRIEKCIGSETVSVFRFNEEKICLENIIEFRDGKPAQDTGECYRKGESLTGWVFENGKSLRLHNPEKDPRYGQDSKRKLPFVKQKHYLCSPMKIGEEIIGVIRLFNKKSGHFKETGTEKNHLSYLERGFSEEDQSFLEIAASHLAVALKNAELFEKLNRKISQFQSLNEVSQRISSEMNIDDLLKLIVRKAAEVTQAEICMLFLVDKERKKIKLKKSYGMPVIEDAFYFFDEGNTGKVIQSGEPILQEKADPDHVGKYDEAIKETLLAKHPHGKRMIKSFMAVPILGKGRALGVLKVVNKVKEGRTHFDKDDLAWFEIFAGQIGVAIENAQLYDLTNRKLVVAERNAELGNLVRSVFHSINNTFGLIPANISAIKKELKVNGGHVHEKLDLIEAISNEAVVFAQELLGLSSGKISERKVLNINEQIEQAINEISHDLERIRKGKKIELIKRFSNESLLCEIFAFPFKQMIRNLVINAFQAMEKQDKGRVLIQTSKVSTAEGDFAEIKLTDTGLGIKQEHLPEIFEINFTTKPRGNGLGLWITKMSLEQIDGRISVISRANEGAVFIVQIPIY